MLDSENEEIGIRKLVWNRCLFILHQMKARQFYNDLGLYQLC